MSETSCFEFWSFELVSKFGFRASDFPSLQLCCKPGAVAAVGLEPTTLGL